MLRGVLRGRRRRVRDELLELGGKGLTGVHRGRHKRGDGAAEDCYRRSPTGRVVGVPHGRRKLLSEKFMKHLSAGIEGNWEQRLRG